MNLSIQDIEYFLLVVEHGQISRAATACSTSQPALSKAIKRLEDETGLQLFERTTRSMSLTSSGLVFVEYARRLRTEYRDAIRHANEIKVGKAGLLRVGATGVTLDTFVNPALTLLLPRRPALHIRLTTDLSDALYAKVEQGDLDLAVIPTFTGQSGALSQHFLGRDSLRVVVRHDHPLLYKPTLTLADLNQYSWILSRSQSLARQRLNAVFIKAGLSPPKAAVEIDYISQGCIDLISSTDVIGVVPPLIIAGNSLIRPVPLEINLTRDICLLSRPNAIWTPLMHEFRYTLERIRDYMPEQGGPQNSE